MKLLFPIVLILIPIFEGCVNQSTVNSGTAEEVLSQQDKKLLRSARLSAEEMLTEQEDVKFPKLQMIEGKLLPLSQLQFTTEENGRLHVQDLLWNETWKDDFEAHKVVFWDTEFFADVRGSDLLAADVEDMRGFEFSPLILKMKNLKPWEGKEFAQHFIQIPLKDGQNRNHWKEGNLEYFFLPDDFRNIGNTHIPQFYKDFPDYSLPSDKTGITSLIFADDLTNEVASKGYTFTASFQRPELPRVEYDYDNWLYESGAPAAYTTGQKEINDWLARVDEKVLQANFRKYLMANHAGASHLVLNWEAVRDPAGPGAEKLARCLEINKKERPYQTISLWPKGGMELSRIQIEGNNFRSQLTRDLTFNGTLNEWNSRFGADSPFWINGFTVSNADILYVGGYLNSPTNFGYVHHFLMQHMMNKKFFPTKKSLLMWWSRVEYVGGFDLGNIWFQDKDGEWVYAIDKPMVFPSAMHNAAVWSFALCDGGELWNEPFGLSDKKDYLGGKLVRNRAGTDIRSSLGPVQNEIYAIQNYRNVDRWEGGKWAVSQNKDIIEAPTSWEFVSSGRDGQRFSEGTSVLPSASLYDTTPLVAAKPSEDSKELLLLVYDAWNNPLKMEVIHVKWKSQEIPVKVFGRYTTVVRVKI